MVRCLELAFLLIAACVVATCTRQSASGVYLAKFNNGLARLQLVQTPDKRLSGQIDWVTVDGQGYVKAQSLTVSGASDGSSISLTIRDNGLISSTATESGSLTWSGVTLTGNLNAGRLSTIKFVRSNDEEYQAALANVQEAARKLMVAHEAFEQQIAAARAVAEQQRIAVAKIEQFNGLARELAAKLRQFANAAEVHLQRWPRSEEMYLAFTSDMQGKLARERSLQGEANNVVRGQMSVAIHQEAIAADQFENELQSLRNSYNNEVVPLLGRANEMIEACQANTQPAIAPSCSDLTSARDAATPKLNAFETGLTHLEALYQEQHEKQTEIANASDRAE